MFSFTSDTTIYIAKPDFLDALCAELGDSVQHVVGNMVFSSVKKETACFALDIWYEPICVSIESISHAAKIVRAAGKYWYLNPIDSIRRARLIEQKLMKMPTLIRAFPHTQDIPAIGCFTLLSAHTLIYASKRLKKWPLGECYFIEDKYHPPNRAYLKLWEALHLLEKLPQQNEKVLDLGASPGGWTYVMHSLGAHVTAIDKAPLDPKISQLPHVTFVQQSAFDPQLLQNDSLWDWVVCDVACYPERLYPLVLQWIASQKTKQMIFTVKLQGETDLTMIKKFQEIPGACVLQLFYNKHEATFFYPAPLFS